MSTDTDRIDGILEASIFLNERAVAGSPPAHRSWKPRRLVREISLIDRMGFFKGSSTIADGKAWAINAVFYEVITLASSSWATIKMAHATDPMQGLGSLAPTRDPGGGVLKVMYLHNLSSPDARGRSVAVDGTTDGPSFSLGVNIPVDTPIQENDNAILIVPGEARMRVWPQGTISMDDGVREELALRRWGDDGSAELEVFLAWG